MQQNNTSIYAELVRRKAAGQKSFAVLVDPDKTPLSQADELIRRCLAARVDFLFVGGSLVVSTHLDQLVKYIKQQTNLPVVLFP